MDQTCWQKELQKIWGSKISKGIIISAPGSGSGKTLFTLSLLRHLKNRKIRVNSAKIGPDYIDIAFHSFAINKPSMNIDTWAMRDKTLDYLLEKISADSELIVVEGVMGLFDGALVNKCFKNGSTASLAEKTGWPIVLIVDASSMAQSAAALIKGFMVHNKNLEICGVVFNKVGGLGHRKILSDALQEHLPQLKIFGFLPRNINMNLPERYLGLEQASENQNIELFMDDAAHWLAGNVDIDALVSEAMPKICTSSTNSNCQIKPIGQRIAVAKDEAFSFIYESVLQGWSDAGAEVTTFSPLLGEFPSVFADSIYLPGGYPELYASELVANDFGNKIRSLGESGIRILGECGGYMVLGRGITDKNGGRFKMAGLLPLETSFEKSNLHLGYRKVSTLTQSPLGGPGCEFKGHEFHYANIISETGAKPLFKSTNAKGDLLGDAGMTDGNIAGSFIHLVDQCED